MDCQWSCTSTEFYHLLSVRLHNATHSIQPSVSTLSLCSSARPQESQLSRALDFLAWVTRVRWDRHDQGLSIAKVNFVLATRSGWLNRADIFRIRLKTSRFIEWIEDLVPFQEEMQGWNSRSTKVDLTSLLSCAAAGLLEPRFLDATWSIEEEFTSKLAYPWTVPTPFTPRRLVIVGARPEVIMEQWLVAAYNVALSITIVGPQGRWMQHEGFTRAVESYVPINMDLDDELPTRISSALNARNIQYDGITTFTDIYIVATARAALLLGLPTAPLSAVELSIDKYRSRARFPGACQSTRVGDYSELMQHVSDGRFRLDYPLIVKPSQGWASEGVSKVTTEVELATAFKQLKLPTSDSAIVVESYLDGPEVDANFVLLDGETLFFEIVDDFPCTAEREDLPGEKNFLETEMVYPSALPLNEVAMIREELGAMLRELGFLTGVFHVEARIQHSSVAYQAHDKGVLDLAPLASSYTRRPVVTLLEINQRAPGIMCQHITLYRSGVDWTALHLLAAVRDNDRYRSLSTAFAPEAEELCALVHINTEYPGVYNGEDFAVDLKRRRPDLASYVKMGGSYYRSTNPLPSAPSLVGHLVVSTGDHNRVRLLRAWREIRNEVRLPIVPLRRV